MYDSDLSSIPGGGTLAYGGSGIRQMKSLNPQTMPVWVDFTLVLSGIVECPYKQISLLLVTVLHSFLAICSYKYK